MNGDKVPTDELDQRVAQLFMFDFEQSGIHLDEDKVCFFLNPSILHCFTKTEIKLPHTYEYFLS